MDQKRAKYESHAHKSLRALTAAGSAVIVPHMMSSISGMPLYREHNILDDLVRRSVALVIDRYLRASADRYGTPQLGSHPERYLVDALRRLVVSDSACRPNAERSRAWFGADGLFLVWPNAAAEIPHLLESDQLPGIPKAPETMLEILVATGVFEPKDASQASWQIVPPEAKAAIETRDPVRRPRSVVPAACHCAGISCSCWRS
jgi:conjugal transfer pilus assembly protein TraI